MPGAGGRCIYFVTSALVSDGALDFYFINFHSYASPITSIVSRCLYLPVLWRAGQVVFAIVYLLGFWVSG